MPKIIKNGRENLMAAAKEIALKEGLGELTIRKVAETCGYSIGMVYNYFESKEYLILAFMLEDWNRHLESMEAFCEVSSPQESFRYIFNEIASFTDEYETLFKDRKAIRQYTLSVGNYRRLLVEQISKCVCATLEKENLIYSSLLCDMIANEILVNQQKGARYSELESVLLKMICA